MSIFTGSIVTEKERFLPEKIPEKEAYLDKSSSKKTFQKKARSKFFTVPLAVSLAEIVYADGAKTPLEKSYRNSVYCAGVMLQEGIKVTSRYCGNRWCTVCARIRTAKMINGYLPELDKMKDKYFVTLTLRNCKAEELKNTLVEMKEISYDIRDELRKKARYKKNIKNGAVIIKGIEKLECTWNRHDNTYHPHFHYIIEGADAAYELIYQWLMRVPANPEAQDIQPCRKNSEKEIFKYFTKIVTKIGRDFRIYLRPLDTIFVSMKGFKVFSTMGLKKEISEEIDDLQSEIVEITPDKRVFTWIKQDWHEITEDGEVLRGLSGYIASEAMIKLTNSIDTVLHVKLLKMKLGEALLFTFDEAITENGINYILGRAAGENIALSYSYLWKHLDRTAGQTHHITLQGLKEIKNTEYKMFVFEIKTMENIAISKIEKVEPMEYKTTNEIVNQVLQSFEGELDKERVAELITY
jgi:hypothetical protein